MKYPVMSKLFFILVGLTLMLSIRCGKDEKNRQHITEILLSQSTPGLVSFGFAPLDGSTAPKDDPTAVVVTVTDPYGNVLNNQEILVLNKINGNFISQPLELMPGSYLLDQFIAIGEDGESRMATPLSGSDLAFQVSAPLSISFAVSSSTDTAVTTETVSTASSCPGKFGYVRFQFNIIETFNFLIGALVYNQDIKNYQMTASTLTVRSGSTTLFSGTVPAANTPIRIRDGYSTYRVIVTKRGYTQFNRLYSSAALKAYSSKPLVVVLQ